MDVLVEFELELTVVGFDELFGGLADVHFILFAFGFHFVSKHDV